MDHGNPHTNGGGSPGENFYELDDMGFLASVEKWTPDFVELFACEEGISKVTESHRALINYARDYFLEKGRSPMPPDYARRLGQSIRCIQGLFPKGLMSIHRLAGLPQPKTC